MYYEFIYKTLDGRIESSICLTFEDFCKIVNNGTLQRIAIIKHH